MRGARSKIARETGADDLEVFALSLLGRAEVSAGRRSPGMQLLEEAMVAASAPAACATCTPSPRRTAT